MIKVGLTGNIGSGKSIVARIFEILGVPVFRADEVAKEFLFDSDVKAILKNKFGKKIFTGKNINRKALAEIVFNDKESLSFLNSVIHPLVKKSLEQWLDNNKDQKYIIQEAAILFESGFYKEFDKVITVASPENLAIKRVMERDGVGEEEVKNRQKNQWSQEKKIEMSDYIIYNDNTKLLIPQVLRILMELKK
ncbi:MAG: dephospho-CoA kinase [Bacteroidetes bacterium]|nr:dephospho-CoA kinase [Bacteroidota bacterium]MBL7105445.1 dephospho-CoA kinase [Bacteroidales bacterium]